MGVKIPQIPSPSLPQRQNDDSTHVQLIIQTLEDMGPDSRGHSLVEVNKLLQLSQQGYKRSQGMSGGIRSRNIFRKILKQNSDIFDVRKINGEDRIFLKSWLTSGIVTPDFGHDETRTVGSGGSGRRGREGMSSSLTPTNNIGEGGSGLINIKTPYIGSRRGGQKGLISTIGEEEVVDIDGLEQNVQEGEELMTTVATELDTCPLCRRASQDDQWVQCSRCEQWVHVHCDGISLPDAELGKFDYFCPSCRETYGLPHVMDLYSRQLAENPDEYQEGMDVKIEKPEFLTSPPEQKKEPGEIKNEKIHTPRQGKTERA